MSSVLTCFCCDAYCVMTLGIAVIIRLTRKEFAITVPRERSDQLILRIRVASPATAKWRWVFSLKPRPLYPWKEPWCPLNMRLDVPRRRSGRFGEGTNTSTLPRIDAVPRSATSVVTALTELFVACLQSTAATQLHCRPKCCPVQCFTTVVRPRPGKFFFHKTRARSQQIYS